MNLYLDDSINVAIFQMKSIKDERSFDGQKAIFLGTGKEFNKWKYDGDVIIVCLRIRHKHIGLIELVGTMYKDVGFRVANPELWGDIFS